MGTETPCDLLANDAVLGNGRGHHRPGEPLEGQAAEPRIRPQPELTMTTDMRIPVAQVVADLATMADKIRALAKADYTRSEIAKHLGVRYQRVRNVLVAADIAVDRVRLAPSHPAPPPDVAGPASPDLLLRSGFELVGEWRVEPDGSIWLDGKAPHEPGVYALVVDLAVMYVGVSLDSLRGRMGHYRRGHERQLTSARVNKLIRATLAAGDRVEVLVATPSASEWNGLPVVTAAGLEAGLIQRLRPAWNKQGAVRREA